VQPLSRPVPCYNRTKPAYHLQEILRPWGGFAGSGRLESSHKPTAVSVISESPKEPTAVSPSWTLATQVEAALCRSFRQHTWHVTDDE
jgi:hypothetical protein